MALKPETIDVKTSLQTKHIVMFTNASSGDRNVPGLKEKSRGEI